MKKDLFWILFFALFICSCSREDNQFGENEKQSRELIVSGSLSEYITEENIFEITKLTINSVISGEDWNILFETAVLGNLEILDMSNARIKGVEDHDYWKDDVIPDYSFSGSKKLKEVFLPNNIKVIGTEAFSSCKKLTTVHFPEKIDSIAARAFYKSGLSGEFNVPSQLRVVGKQVFAETKFSKVVIHSNVLSAKDNTVYTLYGNSVFANCDELKEVIVKEGCTVLELGFANCNSLKTVSLPNSLRTIGYMSRSTHNYIFHKCESLETIKLPKNLWFIGYNAFSHTSLRSINIPDSVQYLWTYAFSECKLLDTVVLPASLLKIDHGCFEGCEMLNNIILPEKVSEIGSSAFGGCSSLLSVSFGDDLLTIGERAFINCTSLKSVIFPSALEKLGPSAFEGCRALSKVVISDEIQYIESTTFKDCTELRDVTIGKSVTTIGGSSFFHCPKLTTLVIPISVNNIEDYAFSYSGLKELMVEWSSPINVSTNIFDGINLSKSTLKVPFGTKELYEISLCWQNFGTIVEL